jgi:hypothetical protein
VRSNADTRGDLQSDEKPLTITLQHRYHCGGRGDYRGVGLTDAGTASEHALGDISSIVVALPSRRIGRVCEDRTVGARMVYSVMRVRSANTRC